MLPLIDSLMPLLNDVLPEVVAAQRTSSSRLVHRRVDGGKMLGVIDGK
jgi:hypothetical protein